MAEAHTVQPATLPTEMHYEASALGINAAGWVALSMLVVIAIMLWKKVPQLITGMLDNKIATIRTQLDEAGQLRAEAESMLAEAKQRQAASAGDSDAIVRHAEQEAQAMLAKAEADAADLVTRRQRMAEDKIAAAERAALAEVRARTADAAVRAAAAVIAEHHGADADRQMVDRAIAGLGRPN